MINYTVVRNDNLWNISIKYLGNGLRWKEIANLNGINVNNPIIYPGQVLKINTSSSGSTPPAKTTSNIVSLQYFGLQAGTESTVFLTWTWSRANTKGFEVIWHYKVDDGVWFIGNRTTVDGETSQSLYSAPSNAVRVKVKVKPISETYQVNNTDVAYWTGQWSGEKEYNFKDNPPIAPTTPTVKIEQYKLTATLTNLTLNATAIQFEVVKDAVSVYKTASVNIVMGAVEFSCNIAAGSKYTVRARGQRGSIFGPWSSYSSPANTIPATPSGINELKSMSHTSVYLSWSEVPNAVTYDIEYATELRQLGASNQSKTVTGIETLFYELGGLESGHEYFFRIRSVNSVGHSAWSTVKSVIIGKTPVAPTTWSSSTTVITGEALVLYWVHNSEDGSSQKYADLELYVNGQKQTHTIRNTDDEDEKDKTSFFEIDTSTYIEGTQIKWRVRTSGVTLTYGEWSVQREINIYAPPTLDLSVTLSSGQTFTNLEQFPFYVRATAGPPSQQPIGYHLTVVANEPYVTLDNIGRPININANQAVFDRHYDISNQLVVEMSAFNIDLENNINYTVICTVSMNSGLTAENRTEFKVQWTEDQYVPNAEIGYNKDTYSTYIRPYVMDENNDWLDQVFLSVYRRDFDGSFVEIVTGMEGTGYGYTIDPHPALDYARYRIVASDKITGAVSYYDPPGYPVQEKAVILQWDEDWSYFDSSEETEMERPPWTGSLLRLPYNIDVSDKYDVDVAHVEYIGRSHPVSYYGTQIGEGASWSMDVDKSDKDTLYLLRRLARWTGDVYVREPSGAGYWATVGVSFNQEHTVLTIPVSLDITRVEGGM